MKEYRLTIDGEEFTVAINSVTEGNADVTVNGNNYSVCLKGNEAEAVPAAAASDAPAAVSAPAGNTQATAVTSPLPGIIVELCVTAGQAVRRGQKVAVLEAMKMENDILAENDGTVASVNVAKGDSVPEGAIIITMN